MQMRAAIAILTIMMLSLACSPAYDACIRLVKENEELAYRNYRLSRAGFASNHTTRLIYLNDPHYRTMADRTITDNVKQIEANNEVIAKVCVETE